MQPVHRQSRTGVIPAGVQAPLVAGDQRMPGETRAAGGRAQRKEAPVSSAAGTQRPGRAPRRGAQRPAGTRLPRPAPTLPGPGSAREGRSAPTHLRRGRSWPRSSCRKCEAERYATWDGISARNRCGRGEEVGGARGPRGVAGAGPGGVGPAGRGRMAEVGSHPAVSSDPLHPEPFGPSAGHPLVLWMSLSPALHQGIAPEPPLPAAEPCAPRAPRKYLIHL